MIDFGTSEQAASVFRGIGQDELSRPLIDDNNLLAYLQQADYLRDSSLGGYLPAALFAYHGQPDKAELLVDKPLGEAALTRNGGPVFTYESTHTRLDALHGSNGTLAIETGNVIETTEHERMFLPKAEQTLEASIRYGKLARAAVEDACQEIGLNGLAQSKDFIHPRYHLVFELSFTRAIRVAAGWASYRYTKPWDPGRQDYYPRTFEQHEILACLKASLGAIKNSEPYRDIDIINANVIA